MQQPNTITAVKNTRVQIGDNNYELHIPKVQFGKTEPRPVTFQGGTPEAQYPDVTPEADHVAKITLGHDYQNPESAYAFFRAHPDEQVLLQWKPDAAGPYTVSATITIVSPNPGGDYGKQHQSEISCPSTRPVDSYDAAAEPTITGLVPDTAAAAGGEDLFILGTGFAAATEVAFGGVAVPFTHLGGGVIRVVTPAHAAGSVNVTVENPEGTSDPEALTYA